MRIQLQRLCIIIVLPLIIIVYMLAVHLIIHQISILNKSINNEVHIGIIQVGFKPILETYIMIKSILMYRNIGVNFHIICDNISQPHLDVMFQTWGVAEVTVKFYNINETFPNIQASEEQLKIIFPKIVGKHSIEKMIFVNTGYLFTFDIYEIWKLYGNFKNEVVGLIETSTSTSINKKTYNTNIILYHVRLMFKSKFDVSSNAFLIDNLENGLSKRMTVNAFALKYPQLVYHISYLKIDKFKNATSKALNFNIIQMKSSRKITKTQQNQLLAFNGKNLRNDKYSIYNKSKIVNCSDFEQAYNYKWRILLYIRDFKYKEIENDVTLVSQLSFNRIHFLEELSLRWEGPMSLVLYMNDAEVKQSLDIINNSKTLRSRYNIAYHVVFKRELHFPLNICRNIAWKNAITPYVFLLDIDFLPMQQFHTQLRKYISSFPNMWKKALVVPSFETKANFNASYPNNKREALELYTNKQILRSNFYFPRGHRAANYSLWATATEPYEVQWEFNFEPYVVISQNATKYDERFVGYGRDKMSHIMTLYAEGYQFIGLPESFVVHRRHPRSIDGIRFQEHRYKSCLFRLMEEVTSELNKKYNLHIHATSP